MIEATFDRTRFDDQGEIVLTWINEMVDQEKCGQKDTTGVPTPVPTI